MTKEEAKQLKYVETQRDAAKAERDTARAVVAEYRTKIEVLSEELEASLKGESATLDALKGENGILKAAIGLLHESLTRGSADIAMSTEAMSQMDSEHRHTLEVLTQTREKLETAEARIRTLEADTEGKDKLKKRLAAKAEELRLCQNELGALKAAVTAPQTVKNAILSLAKRFGTAAIMDILLAAGEIERLDQPGPVPDAVPRGA